MRAERRAGERRTGNDSSRYRLLLDAGKRASQCCRLPSAASSAPMMLSSSDPSMSLSCIVGGVGWAASWWERVRCCGAQRTAREAEHRR